MTALKMMIGGQTECGRGLLELQVLHSTHVATREISSLNLNEVIQDSIGKTLFTI